MALMWASIARWCQEGRELCLQAYSNISNYAAVNEKKLAAGSMIGLSMAASIFLSSPAIPIIFPLGAIVGLAPSFWMYSSQNWKKIARYTGPTAVTLLAVTIFTFHGLGSWRQILDWLPVFLCATLLTTVNVTPKMTVMITALGEGLFAIITLGRSFGPIRSQSVDIPMEEHAYLSRDVERLAGTVTEMSEHQSMHYQRLRSRDSIESFIQSLPQIMVLEPQGQDVGGSIDLDILSQTTTTEIQALVERTNGNANLAPQLIEFVPVCPLDEPILSFPNPPQDLVPRSHSPGSTSVPKIEEPIPKHLVPE